MPHVLFAIDGILPIGPIPVAVLLAVAQAVFLVVCTFFAVRGVLLVLSPYREGGWWLILFALLGAGGAIALPMLLGGFFDEEEAGRHAQDEAPQTNGRLSTSAASMTAGVFMVRSVTSVRVRGAGFVVVDHSMRFVH